MANTQKDKKRHSVYGSRRSGAGKTRASGRTKTRGSRPSGGKGSGASRRLTRAQRMEILRRKRRYVIFLLVILAATFVGIVALVISAFLNRGDSQTVHGPEPVSQEVQAYKPLLEQYAAQYGISEYVDLLMAIMQVESGGVGSDVMQSSESLGLTVNSLEPEASIEQGCSVFSQLLSYGAQLGCDLNSVIQAYNFGITYLTFVSENGKVHTSQLAQDFARDMSGGETVTYRNELSVERNGGWRYNYGNMFYVDLVRMYWSEESSSQESDLQTEGSSQTNESLQTNTGE